MWLPPAFDRMLPELRARPNWVLAKAVMRDGKLTKPPFQSNGRPASVTDPCTWTDFKTVKQAYQTGDFIGVGFVLDGEPKFNGKYLHGFDWDGCIVGGNIDPLVMASVSSLRISRLEVSISGTGLRGFFLHDDKLPSRKTRIDGRSVECYSHSRYMTTTGHTLPGMEVLL